MARAGTSANTVKPVKAGVTPVKANVTRKTTAPVKATAARKTAGAQAAAVDTAVKKPVEPQVKPAVEVKEKPRKVKLVRDSFTMPEAEYAVLGDVKKACLKAGIEVKKSELLRIGVALIRQLDAAKLKEILVALPALKAGRPKKSK